MIAWLLPLLALSSISLAKFNDLVIPYHPHPTNCSKYVLRDWSVEVIFDCQTGLFWNDAKKTCDYPWRSGCTTQSEALVVPSNLYFIKCPILIDSAYPVYLVHADISKYYMCTPSELLEFSCESRCSFNTRTKRCECLKNAENYPIIQNRPVQGSSIFKECPATIDPNNPIFMPHENCTKFIVCTAKGPMVTNCNDGFHWSVVTNRCERPWDAGCIEINTISTTTVTTQSPTTASMKTTKEEEITSMNSSEYEDISEVNSENPTENEEINTTASNKFR
ncbi:uncharacterized protein LOC134214590 [Armigeres subalbatus]|uniref:uncharacterized protein LOC134214590 n=1 Tax=Armigeres subalbatus TaxID=124917 RepID=UPI002ED4F4B4